MHALMRYRCKNAGYMPKTWECFKDKILTEGVCDKLGGKEGLTWFNSAKK